MSQNKHVKQTQHHFRWIIGLIWPDRDWGSRIFGYHYFNSAKETLPREVKLTAVGDSLTQGVGDPNQQRWLYPLDSPKSDSKKSQCSPVHCQLWHFGGNHQPN